MTKIVPLAIPDIENQLYVREMSLIEKRGWISSFRGNDASGTNNQAQLVARSLCDENGVLFFCKNDAEPSIGILALISSLSRELLEQIALAAGEVNRLDN